MTYAIIGMGGQYLTELPATFGRFPNYMPLLFTRQEAEEVLRGLPDYPCRFSSVVEWEGHQNAIG